MQLQGTLPELFERADDPEALRQRALARLDELVRLDRELEQTAAADRAVPLTVLRRAIFAAYRATVEVGAGESGACILREAGHAAPIAPME